MSWRGAKNRDKYRGQPNRGRNNPYSKNDASDGPPEVITISNCGHKYLHGNYSRDPKTGRYVRKDGDKMFEILHEEAIIEEEPDDDSSEPVIRKQKAWFISRTDDGVEHHLDYHYVYSDESNPGCPPLQGWRTLFGQDPAPKLKCVDLFSPDAPCMARKEGKNGQGEWVRGKILHKAVGGYVVEVSDKRLPMYFPIDRLKKYQGEDIEIGDLVETKIISGRFRDVWIDCQVTAVKPNGLYNLRVFNHREYNVCAYAKDVPGRLIRKKAGVGKRQIKVQFQIGQYVETQIISGIHGGKWIGARISGARVDGTYDIEVMNPAQYNVSSRAVSVPATYLRNVRGRIGGRGR